MTVYAVFWYLLTSYQKPRGIISWRFSRNSEANRRSLTFFLTTSYIMIKSLITYFRKSYLFRSDKRFYVKFKSIRCLSALKRELYDQVILKFLFSYQFINVSLKYFHYLSLCSYLKQKVSLIFLALYIFLYIMITYLYAKGLANIVTVLLNIIYRKNDHSITCLCYRYLDASIPSSSNINRSVEKRRVLGPKDWILDHTWEYYKLSTRKYV